MASPKITSRRIITNSRGELIIEVTLDDGSIWHIENDEWVQVAPSDNELLKTFPKDHIKRKYNLG